MAVREIFVGTGSGFSRKPIKIEIQGATPEDIKVSIENLGKLPVNVIAPSVRKGATMVKRVAKGYAPYRTGALRKGIVVRSRKERTSVKGKAVFDVWIDPGMSDVFVKGWNRFNRAYYPASMEYGFYTVRGKRIDGKHYLRTASEELSGIYEEIVIDDISRRLKKLWEKQQEGSTT